MSTINIRGNEYEPVASRVARFRHDHPSWAIRTEVVSDDGQTITIKAEVATDEGRLLATGHASETRGAGQINKTSALENAETSAVGRALAFAGYDLANSIASADEVQTAQAARQPQPQPQRANGQAVTDKSADAFERARAALQTVDLDATERSRVAAAFEAQDVDTLRNIYKAAKQRAALPADWR